MKILTLHCDYVKFKSLKKALKDVEELSAKDKEEHEVKECLLVLTSIEQGDSSKEVKQLIEAIEKTAKEVKTDNIVLYPYAHLSSNLAKPNTALELLKESEAQLSKKFKHTIRAPFGYYKELEFKCKGHPLAELSKEFRSEGQTETKSKIVVKEEPIDHKKLLNQISRSKLDTSKLKDNDHRILGQKLDLFSFNEVAPGMVFWHNNGLIIYNELINFWRVLHKEAEYKEISTPQILDKKLWQISGHWEKYKENIFLTECEKRSFAVKPMNCPGGLLVYKTSTKSYKDLPLKAGEFGVVHRCELSGVLGGLFRVIQFTQDDAHIFCTENQLQEEIKSIIELDEAVYSKFGFEYSLELSTRPEKRIGSDEIWDKAEKALKNVLDKRK